MRSSDSDPFGVELYHRIREPHLVLVSNRYKEGFPPCTLEELSPKERQLLAAVGRIFVKTSTPYISLECWLCGRIPAMTVDEVDRAVIYTIAYYLGLSLVAERKWAERPPTKKAA